MNDLKETVVLGGSFPASPDEWYILIQSPQCMTKQMRYSSARVKKGKESDLPEFIMGCLSDISKAIAEELAQDGIIDITDNGESR